MKTVVDEVFEITGKDPLLDVAVELERIARSDDFFIKRKLYPNVDFYSGKHAQSIALLFPAILMDARCNAENPLLQFISPLCVAPPPPPTGAPPFPWGGRRLKDGYFWDMLVKLVQRDLWAEKVAQDEGTTLNW